MHKKLQKVKFKKISKKLVVCIAMGYFNLRCLFCKLK